MPFWHGVPFTTLFDVQPPIWLQLSAVHGFMSLHDPFTGVLVQPASVQVSVVQATLSLQAELTVTF